MRQKKYQAHKTISKSKIADGQPKGSKFKHTLKKFIRKRIISPINKNHIFFQAHPIFAGLIIIVTYFLLDLYMVAADVPDYFGYMGLGFALLFLYIGYVHTIVDNNISGDIKLTKKRKQYIFFGFVILTVLTSIITVGYNSIIAEFIPSIFKNYFKSQVILLIVIAPITEELAFRYFLYDKWAKERFGVIKGMLIVGTIFVLTHPITTIEGFALYWLPTLFFYLIYNNYGLYASIIAHMIFNIVAMM